MKLRNLPFLLALAALAFLPAPEAFAQLYPPPVTPYSVAIGADNTDVALLVKYVGSAASGKVAVAAGGDITFTEGAEGGEVANTTFECPVSGGLGGVITVANAACDTLGEVCDVINGNTASGGVATTSTNWRCVILDGLRADSSNDTLLTFAATAATANAGLQLKWDTAVAFKATGCLNCPRTIDKYYANSQGPNPGLNPNVFSGIQTALVIANATSTYGSGTSNLQIISSKPANRVGATGSETTTTLYQVAGGATTVNKVLDFSPWGIVGKRDERILFRINNSAAASAVALYAYALAWPYKQ